MSVWIRRSIKSEEWRERNKQTFPPEWEDKSRPCVLTNGFAHLGYLWERCAYSCTGSSAGPLMLLHLMQQMLLFENWYGHWCLPQCLSVMHTVPLTGGFAEFSSSFPGLCEGKSTLVPTCISQPCLPVSNIGPTRILPHLYLGCQRDVLNKVSILDVMLFTWVSI